MKYKKIIYLFSVFTFTICFTCFSQNETDIVNNTSSGILKNNLRLTYNFVNGRIIEEVNYKGSGFEIGASRYIWREKFYVDASYGKMYVKPEHAVTFAFQTKTPHNYYTVPVWTLGAGYDLFSTSSLILSGEVHYQHTSYNSLESRIIENGVVTYEKFHREKSGTAQLQGKCRYFFSKNLQWVSSIGYGFHIQQNETFWLKTGLGIAF